jgi:phenylacetate-coenzyme A ligase PaaK-like adenylate-forming protein
MEELHMRIGYERRRLGEFASGLRASRDLIAGERLPLARPRARQQQRLDAMVRHAAAASPSYRERLGALPRNGPVDLESLPVLTKAEMMDGFDRFVTDRRLRRDELLHWVARAERDAFYSASSA